MHLCNPLQVLLSATTESVVAIRTTQSCLNCHTSKRMVYPPTVSFGLIPHPSFQCDRKRPCGRCIQLGIVSACTKLTTPVKGPRQPMIRPACKCVSPN
ncbi:hypothetical protein EDB87DRAFT_244229 [Lactarius vividus]|nr:hypothetical protein EDB87DRAFT_244229 [Lactarius vividus]